MPRRTAAERHASTTPTGEWPPSGPALFDALVAFNHPTRRALYELLGTRGPASVGALARGVDIAVGSASHHLGVLHRAGFVEPAPELAPTARSSWWRSVPRTMSWDLEDAAPGTAGRAVLESAVREQLAHEYRAVLAWMRTREQLPEQWQRSSATDAFVLATPAQLQDLGERLADVVTDWSAQCRADRIARPDEERLPVRVQTRAFPSEPGAR